MPARLFSLVGCLALAACSFNAVQGTAATESDSTTGTGASSSTTTGDPTTSGGGACTPGASVACTCPNGQIGAQVCNPDGKSLGPCACEGGSDSEGGTTTTGSTTDPVTSTTTTGVDTTGTTSTGSSTGPDTTTGVLCDDPGPEPNDVETEAVDLGDLQCDADAKTLTGVLDGGADVDWFAYHGVYNDCGLFAGDPEPTQLLTAGGTVRMCVFVACDDGTPEFDCQDGATMSVSPDGRPGCCNPGDVSFSLNCAGGTETARIFIRLDQGPADACTDYSVEYSYPT